MQIFYPTPLLWISELGCCGENPTHLDLSVKCGSHLTCPRIEKEIRGVFNFSSPYKRKVREKAYKMNLSL